MKVTRIVYFIIAVIFISSCSSDRTNKIKIIDPGNIIEKKITLSEIANNVEYIPLSNEILISNHLPVFTDSLIFIKPSGEGLLAYETNGRLKSRIGKRGRAPGEYQSGAMFTLDNKNRSVYILELKNRILKYSMNGDFLQEIQVKNYGQKFFNEIIYSNNKLYLIEGINQGSGKYDWIVIDTLGNLLFEKFNHIEEFPSVHSFIGSKQEAYNDNLYYWNHINDTIFKISDDKYEPAFLFTIGDFRFPKRKILSISTEYFLPFKIFFTKNYLVLFYNYQFQNITGIYFKNEQQLYSVNKTNDTEKYYLGPGILNDIDGGLPLIPLSYFQNNRNEEFLVGSIYPYELKAHTSSQRFLNSTPIFPNKKKFLKQLADNLDENDNPVLMLVKLKE